MRRRPFLPVLLTLTAGAAAQDPFVPREVWDHHAAAASSWIPGPVHLTGRDALTFGAARGAFPHVQAIETTNAGATDARFVELGTHFAAQSTRSAAARTIPRGFTLDALPLPARHLLNNQLYTFPGIEGAITTVKSSRGCPLNCSFCGYTLAQGLRFRFRSPESVIAELVDLYFEHGIRHVVFRDPIFTTRKDRIHAICDGILEKGMTELEWQCETAVKTLDRPLLEKMARAGCRHISLGVESGNAEIQKKHCGNKLADLDKAEEVFKAARDFGIETRAFSAYWPATLVRSRRRSSFSSGMGSMMMVPLSCGLMPRPDSRIAFSTLPTRPLSQTLIVTMRGSGTLTVPT